MPSKVRLGINNSGARAIGEIFALPFTEKSKPLLGVAVSATSRKKFDLEPGKYVFRFHLDGKKGKYTLTLGLEDGDLVTKEFDTEFGFSGRVLRFTIP